MFDDKDREEWFRSDSRKEASTTIVGQFASGASPEGICDLSGNVWECTASWYDEERVRRTLRGGSWSDDGGFTRCASRLRFVPVLFSDYVGFRLLSPGEFPGSGS